MNYYHLSEDGNLTHLSPRIPRYAVAGYENKTIKRICCSKSIMGCLKAILQLKKDTYYVYKLEIHPDKVVSNKLVQQYVKDAKKTKEQWVLNRTKVTLLGKINAFSSGEELVNGELEVQNIRWKWINKMN